MRQALFSTIFMIAVFAFGGFDANAQFQIKLPKLPKIVVEKPVTDTSAQTSNRMVADSGNTQARKTSSGSNWWIDYQIGKIAEYKKAVDGWNPANQVFPTPNSSDDYITYALSKKERAAWIADKKVQPDAKLDAALDGLKDSLYRRLPEYTINPKSFINRNAADEKLMLSEMSDVPGLKTFKIGLNQATWIIDKNEWGIPKARYKHGLVYGRNPASEDPFCRIWYINVVQEYSGGGTYGATQARFVGKEFIACPAGQ